MPANRPNLLFIMPDQLRPDFLSCYGASFIDTPQRTISVARSVSSISNPTHDLGWYDRPSVIFARYLPYEINSSQVGTIDGHFHGRSTKH